MGMRNSVQITIFGSYAKEKLVSREGKPGQSAALSNGLCCCAQLLVCVLKIDEPIFPVVALRVRGTPDPKFRHFLQKKKTATCKKKAWLQASGFRDGLIQGSGFW
jgi:hypothetical protein